MATARPLGIVSVGSLLPTAYLAAQAGAGIAQRLLAIDTVPAGAGLDARRIDRYPSQLAQPQCPRHLKHLREAVVQGQSMAPSKRAQRPVVHPRAAGKIAQRQILDKTTLQLPRTRDAKRIGVKPHTQHQLRSVQSTALGSISLFKPAQIQTLHYTPNKEAKMIRAQLIPYTRRKQIRLIRTIRLESRHTLLSQISPVEYKSLAEFSRRHFSPCFSLSSLRGFEQAAEKLVFVDRFSLE